MATFGPSKRVVNSYLAHLARGNVLVLDTSALGTSRAMANTIGKQNITVFGVDDQLAQESKAFGIECVPGWSGDVLAKVSERRFDVIYLDYCGTPDGSATFDPMEDMARASTMLTRGGVLACTFCKRCSSVLSKCVNMAPSNLCLQRAFEYCDTSPMIFVVYSARKLPRIGPPLGSVIRVQQWFGRVTQVYLDGVKLELVKKKGDAWVHDTSEDELWEEPFTAIDDVIECPQHTTQRQSKRRRRVINLISFLNIQ